ncbi:tetratricopeptide repeat protein [Bernardetia sp.]|uniref:tetratricopeptide repeat protein n=1 Tax=Bernardetia sp. TaxID=1937974 RepID=UPI0025B84F3D|nr:tetratricopeptide repeat protein [Bernardetia sp.]
MRNIFFLIIFSLGTVPLLSASLIAQHSGGGLEEYVQAETFRAKRQYTTAISLYDKAIAKDPKNYKYFVQQGKCYYLLKRIDDAIECLEKATQLKQDHVESYIALSKLYGYKGNINKVIQYLSAAAQFEDNTQRRLSYRLHILKLLYSKEEVVGFPVHLHDARSLAPQNTHVWYFSAWYHNQEKEYAQAITDAEAGLKLLSDSKDAPRFYFQLGYALHQIGEYEKAKEALAKANVGSFKEKVFKMMPNYQYRLAIAYHTIFEYKTSKEYVQQALKQDPNYTRANELGGQLAVQEINHTPVIERLKDAVSHAKDYDTKARSYSELALLQFQNENYTDAIQSSDSCLIIQPLRYDVRFLRAVSLFHSGKAEEAITEMRQLSHLSNVPPNLQAQFTFATGVMYRKIGKNDFAIQYFKNVKHGDFRYAAQEEMKKISSQ